MAIKSKAASAPKPRARRKQTRINPKVIANIIHLSDERKKEHAREKWNDALRAYISSLKDEEFDIAKHVLMFVCQRPSIIDSSYSCEVIPFPLLKLRNTEIPSVDQPKNTK